MLTFHNVTLQRGIHKRVIGRTTSRQTYYIDIFWFQIVCCFTDNNIYQGKEEITHKTDRQTERRFTDRQPETVTDTERCTDRQPETVTDTERCTDRHREIHRQTARNCDRHRNIHRQTETATDTERCTDRQTRNCDRHTRMHRQTARNCDRHTDRYVTHAH